MTVMVHCLGAHDHYIVVIYSETLGSRIACDENSEENGLQSLQSDTTE